MRLTCECIKKYLFDSTQRMNEVVLKSAYIPYTQVTNITLIFPENKYDFEVGKEYSIYITPINEKEN